MSILNAVPFTAVQICDRFWSPKQRINREHAIPANEEQCRSTGRLEAFKLGWKLGMPNQPHIFWDSDVAKWIEAASYSLHTHPDASLEARLDAIIADITAAQQTDGYLQTHFTVVCPQERWTRFNAHELYCMGHMIEAGVAHHAATGKRSLLDVCIRLADCVDRAFGSKPGQRRGYCGHEEIELALVRLWRATGERRYVDLSQFMVDQRGTSPNYFEELKKEASKDGVYTCDYAKNNYAYFQAHKPVREQDQVVGHAVRAMYLYCGMSDVADANPDRGLDQALGRLWKHTTSSLMYITGGIGSSRHNEGFTFDRDLPNETAYCETCASVGLILWARRMHLRTGDAQYLDVLERSLYNAAIAGMSLDGTKFFYENPLASLGHHHRQGWFECSCCPPNISRLLASLGGYLASTGCGRLSLDLYAAGRIDSVVDGKPVSLEVATSYPWDGTIAITVTPERLQRFALQLRIPAWCTDWKLYVNGKVVRTKVVRGFAKIARSWQVGDRVELRLAMPVQRIHADPRVRQDAGRIALQRGPVVYCLEGCDNGRDLDSLALPEKGNFSIRHQSRLLGGVSTLHGRAWRDQPFTGELYRPTPAARNLEPVTAVPYYAWDNRAAGAMAVWIRSAQ